MESQQLWSAASLRDKALQPAPEAMTSVGERLPADFKEPAWNACAWPGSSKTELERVMGIEPTLAAWEAAVLPLNYTRAGA